MNDRLDRCIGCDKCKYMNAATFNIYGTPAFMDCVCYAVGPLKLRYQVKQKYVRLTADETKVFCDIGNFNEAVEYLEYVKDKRDLDNTL